MKHCEPIVLCLMAVVFAAGCASTKVVDRQEYMGGKLPRPAHIWVYDFAATPTEVSRNSSLADPQFEHPAAQTPEQVAAGRQLGSSIAFQLVALIRDMGLPASRATSFTKLDINDLVLRGYLLSVDEGDAKKRVAIGFGYGASHLATAVEGLQVTPEGLRKLGSGTLDSGGSQTPGGALGVVGLAATANPAGLIVSGGMKAYAEYSGSAKIEGRAKETAEEIAAKLKPKFQQQGWIQ
ncbi:MAG: DUF4410 domain-containing protein [Nitrospira sp.]|nr:DUF4410 domain-containing protein [Nitrospira sp.]